MAEPSALPKLVELNPLHLHGFKPLPEDGMAAEKRTRRSRPACITQFIIRDDLDIARQQRHRGPRVD